MRKQILATAIAALLATSMNAEDTISIEMVTKDDCPPCQRWKDEAKPRLEKLITVYPPRKAIRGEPIRYFPTFYVRYGERAEMVVGYRSWQHHREDLRRAMRNLGLEPVVKTCCRPPVYVPPVQYPRPRSYALPVFRTPVRTFLWWLWAPRGYQVMPCPRCGGYHG